MGWADVHARAARAPSHLRSTTEALFAHAVCERLGNREWSCLNCGAYGFATRVHRFDPPLVKLGRRFRARRIVAERARSDFSGAAVLDRAAAILAPRVVRQRKHERVRITGNARECESRAQCSAVQPLTPAQETTTANGRWAYEGAVDRRPVATRTASRGRVMAMAL